MYECSVFVSSQNTFCHPPHHAEEGLRAAEGGQRGPSGSGLRGWSTNHRQLWESAEWDLHPAEICEYYFTFPTSSAALCIFLSHSSRMNTENSCPSTHTTVSQPLCSSLHTSLTSQTCCSEPDIHWSTLFCGPACITGRIKHSLRWITD